MAFTSASLTDLPIETRLRERLPEASDATYVGQRTVKLTVEELEEVIATIDQLRARADGRANDMRNA